MDPTSADSDYLGDLFRLPGSHCLGQILALYRSDE